MNAYRRLFAPGALLVLLTAAPMFADGGLPSTTTLTVGPSPGTAGSPITLNAVITPQTPEYPTGTVQFSETDNPAVVYTSPVIAGVATLILEPPAGTYHYAAVYSGDSNFLGSTSLTVTEVITSSTNLSFSATPNPALFGQQVTLAATVSPSSATGIVTFYEHSNVVGVAPVINGAATFRTTLLSAGLRNLYARYSGDNTGDAPSISANVSEAVLTKAGLGYGPLSAIPTGSDPVAQVAGDFNLDGIADIAVLNATDKTIKIFLGTNTGGFTAGATLLTRQTPVGLATGDFNGDGILDLAVAAADGVEVFYGEANGAFATYAITSTGGSAATSLTVGDFNKDGLPDIAAVSGTTLYILASQGSSFSTSVFTPIPIGANAATALGVGDFNNDGLPDLVVITSAGANVMLNTSNLSLQTPTYSFAAPVNYPAGSGPNAVLIKDVNGDSNQDLLITNFSDGTVSVLLGTGAGTFLTQSHFSVGPSPTSLASCDFNGDGISDLIVTSQTPSGNNISVMLGTGAGTYQAPLGYAAGNGPSSVIVADFNNDSKPDVAVLSSTTNDLNILLNLYATLAAKQGGGQNGSINNTFPMPLEVMVTAFGTPAANVAVTFTAPGSGASGFFEGSGASALAVSNAAGVATAPAFTANANTGTYSITATGGGNIVTFPLTNNLATCTFQVSPSSAVLFDASGGAQLFTITASGPSCMWNAASASPSVVFSTTSGTGNGTVSALFPANTTGVDESETVFIAGVPIAVTILGTTQVFADVPPTAYYFDAVNMLYAKGITAGCSADPLDYCPTQDVSRVDMAIFIVRGVYGGDNFVLNSTTPYFNDVPANAFGFMWIQKMYELGITAGCGNNDFCPNDSVTRAEMAIFIIRARYGATTVFNIPPTQYFTDVPSTNFAYDWIERLAYDGITSGCAPSLFCPDNPVIRGDMAIFIMKGLFNALYPPGTPEIVSISPTVIAVGETTTVTVTGTNTLFDANTVVKPILNVTIGTITVTSPTSFTVQLTPLSNAITTQPYSIYVVTSDQSEEVVLPNALTLAPPA